MTLAIGCDVSKWQKFFDPANASGVVDFAIQKVSEGLYIHDGLETMWQGVQKVGVRGGYHYQRSGTNWQTQADLFLSLAAKKSFHIYALDLEGYGNTVDKAMLLDTQSIINYWIAQTNKRVVLYTNINYYNQLRYYVGDAWLNTIPLWIAYPNQTPGFPVLPAGRQTWNIHQYSWTDPAIRWGTGSLTDANVYNGTVSQMQAWAGAVTPPPPTGEIMNGTAQEIKGNVPSIRTAPDVSGTKVGSLSPYVIVEFMELVNGSKVATDKWLKLPNGIHYVNQNVGGVEQFKILTMPTTPPPPVPSPLPDITVTIEADGYPTTTTTIKPL